MNKPDPYVTEVSARVLEQWASKYVRTATSRWYCDREGCDGQPHEGWIWCEHGLPHPSGQEYWRCRHARANQRPPTGEWRIWLVLAGRGFGKTRTGGEWLASQAKARAMTTWAAIAPTYDDLKAVCFEGESGLLQALDMRRSDDAYNKTNLQLRLPNGSVIRGLTAEKPERTRGPNLAGAWLDEFAIWKYRQSYDDLLPALRRDEGRICVTTTPRPVPLILEWIKREKEEGGNGSVRVTRGSMWDNAANLSESALAELRTRWEGTRQGRQELYGELLEDIPGALWSRETIDQNRAVLVD